MAEEVQNNEQALIEACKKGDKAAFEKLYHMYKSKVYSLAYHMCGQVETAEDLTQNIFLKAFTRIETYEHRYKFGTWLYRLTINHCIDELRKKNRVQLLPMEENLHAAKDSADAAMIQKELVTAIRRATMKLSDTLRSAFVLKYVAGLSYAEIASILDCSIGTVSSRLNSSLKLLANELRHFKE
jgi:RNA polymerase sigma-70 factor (ECF subfamily)